MSFDQAVGDILFAPHDGQPVEPGDVVVVWDLGTSSYEARVEAVSDLGVVLRVDFARPIDP